MESRMFFDNRTIAAICLGFFFLFCGFDATQQYLVAVFTDKGNQNAGVVALFLIYAFYFIGNFFAPRLIHSIGVRAALVTSALPYAVFSFIALTTSDLFLYGLSVVLGLSVSVLWQASGIAMQRASAPDRMGTNSGLKYSALVGGGLVGIAIGGFFLGKVASENLFWIFGAVSMLGVFAFAFVRVDSSPAHQSLKSKFELPSRSVAMLLPVVFISHIVMAFATSAIKIHAVEIWTLASAAPLGLAMKISALVSAPLAGRSGDKWGASLVLVFLVLISTFALLLLLLTTRLSVAVGAGALLGIFFASVYPLTVSLLRSRDAEGNFDRNIALFQLAASGGLLAGYAMPLLLTPRHCFALALTLLLIVPILIKRSDPLRPSRSSVPSSS